MTASMPKASNVVVTIDVKNVTIACEVDCERRNVKRERDIGVRVSIVV